jgi:hypothetical protein
MVAQQNTGVPYLPLGKQAGKYLLSKISKSGQGQHSVYSVGETEKLFSSTGVSHEISLPPIFSIKAPSEPLEIDLSSCLVFFVCPLITNNCGISRSVMSGNDVLEQRMAEVPRGGGGRGLQLVYCAALSSWPANPCERLGGRVTAGAAAQLPQ